MPTKCRHWSEGLFGAAIAFLFLEIKKSILSRSHKTTAARFFCTCWRLLLFLVLVRRRLCSRANFALVLLAPYESCFFSTKIQPRTALARAASFVRSSLRAAIQRTRRHSGPTPGSHRNLFSLVINSDNSDRKILNKLKNRAGSSTTSARRPAAPTAPHRTSVLARRPYPDGRRRS
ncbi:hypothetical protein TW95_gp1835 [Pandoravirus inopinatum]|uniref:Uncharacterized protein n=1 Tax=Pandoravirus inopinatum TaxID=1605721 RepID=A0A0B5J4L0_9VIRU|nr:hypothetical protein TW95_gp1835 [Pandoravirus inopinatum]AJF98569.1 hypothetical protein [Pandoravirus inopinatum]